MKKTVTYMATGLGIGSFSYVLALISVQEVSVKMIVSVLVMSALIGLTALIYEQEQLKVNYRGLSHMVMVCGLVAGMLAFNGIFNWFAIIMTAIIYLLVFSTSRYMMK